MNRIAPKVVIMASTTTRARGAEHIYREAEESATLWPLR